ncbi:hypothetical protein, variant [Plasmodium yoelii 17X]|uniref:DUF155 domain-containing protein n=4 Tax=Plasmodium yoelii TaxID=5861 RepID=A0AAE9WKJ9_PLAYO|nr:uncharacterized protein PY17X_0517500 [Plasmodium yoelii]EAA22069.1 Uncharacterized ACR, YagE family COG1723, putative [Plasmodium yoelii yoelii]ETB58865.1 hypothetical protein YYC_03630 [Plasmodium yoelii 17X]ETB58866.1 hypothetical protein, variant [Plasmodium yoelii 17X]WBY55702.1 hypothetical protein Py17XNL_000504530 [Plasmodium yoelii yoelii]CDU16764.1 conserved Plasmodium protein, unknown function [Plasmodium yoelii]|eukprot:XP_730504.1 uncharacterized protein PY17X_0517500 [Plasmodium yoelii]
MLRFKNRITGGSMFFRSIPFLSNNIMHFHHSNKEKSINNIYTKKKITKKREKLLCNVKPFINDKCDISENNVIAYYLGKHFNLQNLKNLYESVGAQVIYKEPYLYVESCEYFNQQNSSIVIFKNGCIVFWNMNKKNIIFFLNFSKIHLNISDGNTLVETYDFEELEVQNVNNKSYVNNSIIYLTLNNYRCTDKISFSFGLLSAVRLNNLEKKIENKLLLENNNIENLKQKIKSSNLDLLSKQLFYSKTTLHNLRYELNIEQDILDVPEPLWEYEYQKKLFLNLLNIFDIKQRVDLLNHRLTWTFDYLNSFLDYVNQKHSSRLERIIIIIIGLELILGIMQMAQTVGL